MKKIYSCLLLLVFSTPVFILKAQSEIWGLTSSSTDGFGTMFSMPTGSGSVAFQYNFTGNPGSSPQHTKLLQAANGKLYGLTNTGGNFNLGVLFEYDITNNLYTKKVEFNGTNGSNPRGALMEANNGKLYGLTSAGGTNSVGVLFEYDYVNNIFTKKVDLVTANGSGPYGTLMQAANNKLYGLTRSGGTNSVGVIFEYDLAGTYTKKIDLSTSTGGAPYGKLVAANNGSLYAMASNGGTANVGTVFEYDYVNNVCNKKVDLNSTNGSSAQGSLLLASDGNLYGLTFAGGSSNQGALFQYSVSTGAYTKLFNMVTATSGSFPSGELVQASNGKLYGMNRAGGSSAGGTLFEFDITGPTLTVKVNLVNSTAIGGAPFGSLMIASNGKLYGLTSNGGITGGGVLFDYDISGNTYTKDVDLNSAINGGQPNGSLVYANNNKIYGLTVSGGTNNVGTLFEYDKSISTFTKKVDFSSTNGSAPYGALVQASNGKLYGLTNTGGTNAVGVLFEYDLNGTYTKKVDLSSANGCSPFGSMTMGLNNKLYGVTRAGGTNNVGVVFEYDYINNIYTKKADFISTNGANPSGSMVLASNGKMYGLTQLGGSNLVGVLFEYDYVNNILTKKVDLSSGTGSQPYGSLAQAANGKLYGLTKLGGANSQGVLFEYDVTNNIYTSKIDLSTGNGSQPIGSLIKVANGKLYGMTQSGGANLQGALFEYDIAGTYTKIMDFTGANGIAPAYGGLMEICTSPTVAGAISLSSNTVCAGVSTTNSYSIATISNATSYTWTLPSGASIITGSTTNNIGIDMSGASAGVYTVTSGGVNVCGTGSLSASSITIHPSPLISTNSGSICQGNSFTISPTGALSFTYSSGSSIVSPTSTSTYSITGTNGFGCVSNSPGLSTVTVNAAPTISATSGSICSGASFTINSTGANTYTSSSGSLVVTPTITTTYSINGTDNAGCNSLLPGIATVTVQALPSIGVNSGTMCMGTSFTLAPTGATSYTYSSGSAIVSPTTNSSYSVTGTSSAGCISAVPAVANVTVISLPSISVTSGAICSGLSFTMIPSGASTYTFSSGSAVVSPTSNASYSVTGTSALGCISSNTAISTITVNALPIIGVNSGSICSGATFTMLPTGAFSYTYSSGGSIVSPTTTSSYSVSGTNTNGCISSAPAISSVTVAALPNIGVNSGSICNTASFTMVPNGASSYTFSSGSAVVSPSVTSSYSVTGTSSLGCVSSVPAISTVTVAALPLVSVNSGTLCVGQSFTLSPNGASSYTFSSGSSVVSPTNNTSYSVTGTSSVGCISSNTAVSNLTVYTLPVIGVNSGSICNGSTFTMVPTGAFTYTYSGGSSLVSPTITSSYSVSGTNTNGCISAAPAISTVTVVALPIIGVNSGTVCNGISFTMVPNGASSYTYSSGSAIVTPTTTSTYSVTGTSSVGCVSSVPAIASVTVIALPIVSVNGGTICFGNSFNLVPSGASTYTFSSGGSLVSPTVTSSYSITGTSSVGCLSSNTAVATVTVYALPLISVNSGTICSGKSFTMIPSGASSYTYSSGSSIVSPTTTTNYSVTGTSSNGCISAGPAVSAVTVIALPVVGVTSGSICNGNSYTMVPNGASTYTYSSGSAVVSPTITSNYSVTGTSSVGCVSSNTAVSSVVVFSLPIVSVNSGTICNTGTFTLIATGASSYNFSSGSPVVSPTTTTTYSVSGTSSNGCASSNTAISTITVYALPIISVNSGTICSGKSFTMVPGGASTYTYSSGSSVVSPITTSSYSVTGTSTAGCISPVPAVSTVTVYALPIISLNSGTLCLGKTYTLIASLSPTSSPVTFTYSSGLPTVTPTATTIYFATGTDDRGCVASNTAFATVSVIPLPTISPVSGSICAGNSFTLSSTGAVSYTYSSPTNVVSPTVTSTYSVIGTSSLGCASVIPALLTVTVNPLPLVTISGTNAVCSGSSLTLTATGANSYVWGSTTGSVLVVTPLSSTSYSVLGTSANGCNSLTSIFVTVRPNPTITTNSGFICPGDVFTITPNGALSYTYSGGSNVVSPTITTSYSVTGTNTFGCVSLQPAVSTVSVVNVLTVTISGNTVVCAGESVSLTANGANTYSWNTSATTASIVQTPTASGSYTVIGSSGNCSDTTSVLVTVNPLPVITVVSTNSRICVNETATLSALGANNYTWSTTPVNNNTFIVVSPSVTTIYQVNGIDANGCSNSNSLSLSVDLCLGITNVSGGVQSIKVFPNPTSGDLVVETPVDASIYILNAIGQVVFSKTIYSGINKLEFKEQANGVYFVTIKDASGSKTLKLIKE